MRINKFLADKGLGSRRQIDALIETGEIFVNSEPATLGQQLKAGDKLKYQDREFEFNDESFEKIYLAFNKPKGIVSTCEKNETDNIIDFLKSKCDDKKILGTRLYPVGRLDKESTGLIVLTNDGELCNQLTHPSFEHEKEYLVSCRDSINKDFINKFSSGLEIEIEDSSRKVKTLDCFAEQLAEKQFRCILKQGYKRQIREMVKVLGNQVLELCRIRIANIGLDGLADGEYRILAPDTIFSAQC